MLRVQSIPATSLAVGRLVRESYWSEAFAVGDRIWLADVCSHFGFKRKKILAADEGLIYGSEEAPSWDLAAASEIYYIEG